MKPDNGKVMEKSHYGKGKNNSWRHRFYAEMRGKVCVCVCVLSSMLMNHTHFDFIYSYWPSSDYTGIAVQQHQLSKFSEIYWNFRALSWPITILSELLKDIKVEGRKLALFHVLKVSLSQLEGFGRSGWHLCGVPWTTSVHLNHSVTCLSCHVRR